ncbi:translational GTPase TypA [Pseudomonadota bacterium]
MKDIRNIAIIAHVDHGKTTLIDQMLRQSGIFRENEQVESRIMDSHDLEKERGITILAKCTAIEYENTKINIVDTPGHADFGGEVERVLSMVDSTILLVDSSEGPMPQTKFVLSKALKLGLKPIVVINKIDRKDSRPDEVINEVFDLFVALDANEEQLDFPIMYAVGRDGWCVKNLNDPRENLKPLFDLIIKHVPAPNIDSNAPFSMLSTILLADSFVGRVLTGKIHSGTAKVGMQIKALDLYGKTLEMGRLTKLQTFIGVKRMNVEEARAGDIIAIAGLAKASVADTICDIKVTEPIESTPIDPPTMSITISVNDSPLAGREGKKVTSRMIRDRLFAEAESNVAISVKETGGKDSFEVSGRGELQLGVLIETMRREGFEMSVARPKVLFKKEEKTGQLLEPIEEVVIDVDDEFSGSVVEEMGIRRAEMKDMRPSGEGKTRITFFAPSRGLIGYQSKFMTDTKGTGTMNRLFHSYEPHKGSITTSSHGALISMVKGQAVAYAIWNLQERGKMFIKPQDEVYEGMIVGEHAKSNDLEINVLKGKQLTNIRAAGTDEAIRLVPPTIMTLEQMITYIGEDEFVEITPKSLRLRKKILDSNARKKEKRASREE